MFRLVPLRRSGHYDYVNPTFRSFGLGCSIVWESSNTILYVDLPILYCVGREEKSNLKQSKFHFLVVSILTLSLPFFDTI